MFKALLKKQFKELKNMYFAPRKSSKKKVSNSGRAALYIFLYITFAASMLALESSFGIELIPMGLGWLYFIMIGSISLLATTFINMFISFSIIYGAKDNEMLLAMPIKPIYIVLSRMISSFFNCLIYTSMIFLPGILLYEIVAGFDFMVIISGLVLLLIISLMALILSTLLGYVVGIIQKRFKNKGYVTAIMMVILIGFYYYLNFNMNKYITYLIENAFVIGDSISNKAAFLLIFGKAATGNLLSLLLVVIFTAILFVLFLLLVSKTFIYVLTKSYKNKTARYNNRVSKRGSISSSLFKKELKTFLSIPIYTMNAGLGLLFMVIVSVAAVIFKSEISETIEMASLLIGNIKTVLPIAVVVSTILFNSLNTMAICSLSLEGNTFWILKTLPLKTETIIESKRDFEFKMNLFPTLLMSACLIYVLKMDVLTGVISMISSIIAVWTISYIHVFLGVRFAKLDWVSEAMVVKQGTGMFLDMLLPFVIVPALLFGSFYGVNYLNINLIILIVDVLFILIVYIIRRWISSKGVEMVNNLH